MTPSSTPGPAPLGWPQVLTSLLRGESLAAGTTAWAMTEIMNGDATPVQVAGFAIALRAKGETPEEVTGLVQVMLDNAPAVDLTLRSVDIVGTGGDRANTVNISTMAALVAAGAGVPVAKHGNRAASSATGAADLLENLGVTLVMSADDVARCVREVGIGFFFAAHFHAGLRHAAVARREIGVPTVFNFLGPLTNPARPAAQAVGCADPRMAPVMAQVLAERGVSALLFRGDDGLDELTTTTTSRVWVVHEGKVSETTLDPADLGIARSRPEDLLGRDAAYNSGVAREVLAGGGGPVRDAVLLNAAAALAAHEGLESAAAGDLVGVLRRGYERAAASVDGGRAAEVLGSWVALSSTFA